MALLLNRGHYQARLVRLGVLTRCCLGGNVKPRIPNMAKNSSFYKGVNKQEPKATMKPQQVVVKVKAKQLFNKAKEKFNNAAYWQARRFKDNMENNPLWPIGCFFTTAGAGWTCHSTWTWLRGNWDKDKKAFRRAEQKFQVDMEEVREKRLMDRAEIQVAKEKQDKWKAGMEKKISELEDKHDKLEDKHDKLVKWKAVAEKKIGELQRDKASKK